MISVINDNATEMAKIATSVCCHHPCCIIMNVSDTTCAALIKTACGNMKPMATIAITETSIARLDCPNGVMCRTTFTAIKARKKAPKNNCFGLNAGSNQGAPPSNRAVPTATGKTTMHPTVIAIAIDSAEIFEAIVAGAHWVCASAMHQIASSKMIVLRAIRGI